MTREVGSTVVLMRIKGRSETGHFLPVLPLLGKKVVGRQPLMLLNKRTITAFFLAINNCKTTNQIKETK